jgi:tetratricopeptide (TPR) repeat protein
VENYHKRRDRHGAAQSLNNLGLVYKTQDKWDEAIDCYEQSLQIKRQLGDIYGEAQSLNNLGLVYNTQGKWNEAIAGYEQSLQTKRQLGDCHGVAQSLGNLGSVYINQGRWDEAIACYEKSLETYRQLGDRHGVGQTLMNFGLLHDRRKQIERATILWREALTYLHPSSPEFQTVQQWLETPSPPRWVNYLLPLAVGGFILFCLVKGYWLLAILGVAIVLWLFRRSIFALAMRASDKRS